MTKKLLTVAAVRKYTPHDKRRREIPDAHGLRLVIQPKPSGSKSWALRFRRPDGKPAKLTLGTVDLSDNEPLDDPVLGAPLTLGQARQLAAKIDRDRKRNVDVIAEYKASKSRQRVEAKDRAENTFGAAVREFLRDHKTKWHARPRRWRGEAALLGLRWPPGCTDPASAEPMVIKGGLSDTWHDKPLASIDGHDIHAVVGEARQLGIPGLGRRNGGISESRGRKVHAALSVLFRWALQRRKVAVNPCVGVWHPGAPPARERVLTDAEIAKFWAAADAVGQPFSAALKLLLLTGARRSEVAGMRYDELSDGVWTIPGNRTKNHRAHALPLPPLAREIIATVPRIESKNGFVFTTTGTTPVSGWSKTKRALDAAMGAEVKPWRLHDLRRTTASGMSRLGVRSEVVERCLNHVSGHFGGIAGVYQVDPLSDEVRAALLRWSQHVLGLVAGKSDKIVKLRS
jgi:integrase